MLNTSEYRMTTAFERSDQWLKEKLAAVWESCFPDIRRVNNVAIRFHRRWKSRLGLIKLCEDGETFIGINQVLRNRSVPDPICTVTIAHEIVHYAHGFGSPLPRLYSCPHEEDVVDRELLIRGLGEELDFFDHWTNNEWYPLFFSLQQSLQAGKMHAGDEACLQNRDRRSEEDSSNPSEIRLPGCESQPNTYLEAPLHLGSDY